MLALAAAALCACAGPAPMGPDDADRPPDCSQARAEEIRPGSTLAFVAGMDAAVRTYQVVAATGCWARLDEDVSASRIGNLSVEPGGRFLYGSTHVDERHAGVEAFRIDSARGALEPVGRFPLVQGWVDAPGPLLATEDSVYMMTVAGAIGRHGGLWRFAIERGSGGLEWRALSFSAREPAFIAWWPSRALLYVWFEDLTGPLPYGRLRALRIGPGGDLFRAADLGIDWGQAITDPSGTFLWMTHGDTGFELIDALLPGSGGALTHASTTAWNHRAPAAHPRGRVLYATSGARVDAFAVDAGTGAPRPVASAAAPLEPRRPVVDPTGTFVYVAGLDGVRGYRTDTAGALREIGTVAASGNALALMTVR